MYYPDLSPYEYSPELSAENAKNFGWLEPGHPFDRGAVAPPVLAKLSQLALQRPVNRYRGTHACGFCAEEIWWEDGGRRRLLGSAEIWVPAEQCILIAPDLVIHYILRHEYHPPEAVLTAVAMLPDDVLTWDSPDGTYGRLTEQYQV